MSQTPSSIKTNLTLETSTDFLPQYFQQDLSFWELYRLRELQHCTNWYIEGERTVAYWKKFSNNDSIRSLWYDPHPRRTAQIKEKPLSIPTPYPIAGIEDWANLRLHTHKPIQPNENEDIESKKSTPFRTVRHRHRLRLLLLRFPASSLFLQLWVYLCSCTDEGSKNGSFVEFRAKGSSSRKAWSLGPSLPPTSSTAPLCSLRCALCSVSALPLFCASPLFKFHF